MCELELATVWLICACRNTSRNGLMPRSQQLTLRYVHVLGFPATTSTLGDYRLCSFKTHHYLWQQLLRLVVLSLNRPVRSSSTCDGPGKWVLGDFLAATACVVIRLYDTSWGSLSLATDLRPTQATSWLEQYSRRALPRTSRKTVDGARVDRGWERGVVADVFAYVCVCADMLLQ